MFHLVRLRPLAAVLVSACGLIHAQDLADPDHTRMRADIEYLCGPGLMGRETGTLGDQRAAAYLADQMRANGILPIRQGGFGGLTPYHFAWTFDGADDDAPAGDVVGIIPGQDPLLRSEYVFITAHFDHLGDQAGTLYPGADDNASGTAGLLEVMRLLRASAPRRSLAFLAVDGEEEGLLGSAAFLAEPPVPVAAIKADINMDMIGRGRAGELHVMPARRAGYVTSLTRDARAFATRHGIALSAGIEAYWQDSDHYNFASLGIPSICFNTGLHQDYHQPSDTPDKIDYRKAATVVKIVRDLAVKTANADAAPEVLPTAVWQGWVWGPYQTPNLRPAEGKDGPTERKKSGSERPAGRSTFAL